MKRFLTMLLAGMLCASALASCSNNEEKTESLPESSEISEVSEEEIAMPEYWGSNDYKLTVNPSSPAELESKEMILTKVSDKCYRIETETDAGKLALTIEEMPWGTFNLWSWKLTTKDNKIIPFVPGSTDWEYVYRTSKSQNGAVIWSGGNHGNETLISLALYNGETESEIILANGESIKLNKLHIIEKTKLLWTADTDGDGYGYRYKDRDSYAESDIYAEVTRKYTVIGEQVKLNVDYNYLQDTYHKLSYTGMFPIDKKYGLYCDMVGTDGNIIKTIETSKVGKADYSGPMNDKNAANRVHIYGYTDPRYRFDIRVNTFEDSLDSMKNSFKTAFWDMNTGHNKLYFSKYDANTATLVPAGTKFSTECIWLFVFDEDA